MPITFEESAQPRSAATLRFLAKATDVGYGERIDGGRAKGVRQWSPISDEDRRLDRHALELAEVLRRGETR